MKTMAQAQRRRAPPAGRGGLYMYRASSHTAQNLRALLRAPLAPQRLCAECQEEMQRSPDAPGRATGDVSATVACGIAAGGVPLSPGQRHFFEPRFGQELGHVRLHTDAAAAESAGALDARAYTFGHDIVFGSGEYAPDTAAGRRLLAHELTHVLQQGGGERVSRTLRAPDGVVQCDGALDAWKDDLAKRKAKVQSMAKDGNATMSLFGDQATGKISGYQLTQNFKAAFAADATASSYAIVQWVKGDLYEDTAKGKVYWPASMGLYGRKNTDPWHFTDWIIDTPDKDPRFGSDRGVAVAVPSTSFGDSPGIIQNTGTLPAKLTWNVDARVGIYPWGTRIPTDIAGWESQKPEPFREVAWGWTVKVKDDQKSLDVTVR